MGRRLRGAKLRAQKRGTEAAKEIVETSAKEVETHDVAAKADDDLFVLDTTAVVPSKKQLAKKEKKKRKHTPSAKEQSQIEKLINTHTSEKLQKLVKKSSNIAKRAKVKGSVNPNFDLWGEEESPKKKPKKAVVVTPGIGATLAGIKPSEHVDIVTTRALPAPDSNKKVKVDVAKSGQSYNPDKVEHKMILMKAVEVEKKRQKAETLKKAPISTGMSAETRALLVDDSDTDESSDEEVEENEESEVRIEKKKEKLTRAQRNKQKRLRAEKTEIELRKRQKKLQNSVAEAKAITKKLRKEENELKEKKEELEKKKEENQRFKGTNVYGQVAEENPINAPTYPVALTTELKKGGGSLRTLKPKGSLLTDRMISFTDRDMAAKKQVRRNKRVEGKRRKLKLKVRGKGHDASKEGGILG